MFGGAALYSPADLFYLRGYAAVLIISVFACTPLGKKLYERLPKRGAAAPALIAAALVLCVAYLVDATYNPFLYFRF
jgi:alginate O-acetyltransferase complex protein AlgI